jgi:hypothetical protein
MERSTTSPALKISSVVRLLTWYFLPVLVLFCIQFDKAGFAFECFFGSCKVRSQHVTGATPIGPYVNDGGFVRLQNKGRESFLFTGRTIGMIDLPMLLDNNRTKMRGNFSEFGD